ncbi:hypothetical protein Q0590_32620 [Rhodocytophaga aerolata]|uniref:XRE family transcriptional regulator n=1 Tax=Rhodocytophaga aerolata TaxID=455078 RepID=A0ABT8RG35_9BACT|nr:hypothetical protein [Rhodocytophaga aerolata]MDO1451064.1 hypothetical protein [Rhodocytophaga aerolata]
MDEPKKDDFKNYRSYSYNDALRLVQYELNLLEQNHGVLKKWSIEHHFSYTTIVNIKNDKLGSEAPKMLLKILIALGFEAKLTIDIISTGKGRNEFEEKQSYILRRISTK